jgi:hypothetical protein
MSRYLEFKTATGERVLVEVDERELEPAAGVTKAGLRSRASGTVAAAQATFEEAVDHAIRQNVLALDAALAALPSRPTEVELTFALKATGEVGNVAIGKVGGEANLMLRLSWRFGQQSAE